jgi:hypothetical protein
VNFAALCVATIVLCVATMAYDPVAATQGAQPLSVAGWVTAIITVVFTDLALILGA